MVAKFDLFRVYVDMKRSVQPMLLPSLRKLQERPSVAPLNSPATVLQATNI